MGRPIRLKSVFFGLIILALGGCVSADNFGGGRDNYAAGSSLSGQLGGREVGALEKAFLTAMNDNEPGDAVSWRGGAASGKVIPGRRKAGNLRSDPSELLDFRPGLFLSQKFETELGEYVLTRKSNIRYGPSTETKVAEVLPSGAGVEVVGRVIGEPWMLIAVNGEIRGFIFDKLLVKRPGTELTLAGGPTRRPRLCRAFDQEMRIYGRSDRWSGAACVEGRGWRLLPPRQDAPTALF